MSPILSSTQCFFIDNRGALHNYGASVASILGVHNCSFTLTWARTLPPDARWSKAKQNHLTIVKEANFDI
jgi:hypothetical protein